GKFFDNPVVNPMSGQLSCSGPADSAPSNNDDRGGGVAIDTEQAVIFIQLGPSPCQHEDRSGSQHGIGSGDGEFAPIPDPDNGDIGMVPQSNLLQGASHHRCSCHNGFGNEHFSKVP